MTALRNATPVLVILALIIAVWYAIGAFFMNAPFQRDLDRRAGVESRFRWSSSARR
jgi:NitT/TauT family transport system permease protein